MAATINLTFDSKGGDVALKLLKQLNAELQKSGKVSASAAAQIIKAAEAQKQLASVSQQTSANLAQINKQNAALSGGFKGSAAAAKQLQTGLAGVSKAGQGVKPIPNPVPPAASQKLKEFTDANIRLAGSLNGTINQAKALSQSLGKTPQTTAAIVSRFKELQGAGATSAQSFKALTNEFKVTEAQFQKIQAATRNTEAGFQGLALVAGAVAGSLGALLGAGAKNFLEFENSIKTFGVVSGESANGIEGVRKAAADLGANSSKTAGEVSALTVELGRAGFSGKETEAALEGIVRASEATGESLTTVGSIIGNTVRSFGLSASESQKVADILVTTANNSNQGIADIGEALKFVAPVAKGAGQDLEEVSTILAVLANNGIRGGNAGRNLVQAYQRLQVASAASTTELKELVGGSQQAADALKAIGVNARDSQGNLRPITDLIPELRAGLGTLSQEDQDLVGKALFGVQGGRVIQTLLNTTQEDLDTTRAKIADFEGASVRAGEALQQGLGGALTQFGSAFEGATIAIFEQFAPAAEAVVRAALELLQTFNNAPPVFQKAFILLGTGVGVYAAAVAAISAFTLASKALNLSMAAQTAATLPNTVASKANAAAKLLMALATGKATASQQALTKELILGAAKAGLFAGAVFAVATAVDTFSQIKEAGENARQGIDAIDESLQKVKSSAQQAGESTEEFNKRIEDVAAENLQQVQDDIGGVQKALDFVRGALDAISLKNLLDQFSQLAFIPDQLREKIQQLVGFLDNIPIPGLVGGVDTAAEAAVAEAEAAFNELIAKTDDVKLAAAETGKALKDGVEVDPTELENTKQALEDSITTLENEATTTVENTNRKNAQIEKLKELQATLNGTTDAQKAEANAQAAGVKATQEKTKALADQAEQEKDLREQAKEAEKAAFEDEQGALEDRQSDIEKADAKQLAADIEQIEKESNDRINAEKKVQDAELAAIRKQQAKEVAEVEKAFAKERADAEKAFLSEVEAERDRINTKADAALSEAQKQVERELRLREAQTDEERARIQEEIAAEEEKAALRKQLEEEAGIPEIEDQRTAELEALAAKEQEFQQRQQEREEQFQEKLQQLRESQEEALQAKQEANEQKLNDLKEATQERIEARQEAAAEKQEAIRDAFEQAREDREAAFNEQQRALDEASAAKIEALKTDDAEKRAELLARAETDAEAARGKFAGVTAQIEKDLSGAIATASDEFSGKVAEADAQSAARRQQIEQQFANNNAKIEADAAAKRRQIEEEIAALRAQAAAEDAAAVQALKQQREATEKGDQPDAQQQDAQKQPPPQPPGLENIGQQIADGVGQLEGPLADLFKQQQEQTTATQEQSDAATTGQGVEEGIAPLADLQQQQVDEQALTLERLVAIQEELGTTNTAAQQILTQLQQGLAVQGLRKGGPVASGDVRVVGEAGPELVRFGGPGRVFSNSDSLQILKNAQRFTAPGLTRPLSPSPSGSTREIQLLNRSITVLNRQLKTVANLRPVTGNRINIDQRLEADMNQLVQLTGREIVRGIESMSRGGYRDG